jgi:hypothetical protein
VIKLALELTISSCVKPINGIQMSKNRVIFFIVRILMKLDKKGAR